VALDCARAPRLCGGPVHALRHRRRRVRRIHASTPALAGGNTTNAGWTIGAGIEFALVGNWTARAEYLYVDLGKLSCGAGCGAPVDNVSFTANIVRGGINYRF
jgi:outer membrane immunogenic protein